MNDFKPFYTQKFGKRSYQVRCSPGLIKLVAYSVAEGTLLKS